MKTLKEQRDQLIELNKKNIEIMKTLKEQRDQLIELNNMYNDLFTTNVNCLRSTIVSVIVQVCKDRDDEVVKFVLNNDLSFIRDKYNYIKENTEIYNKENNINI